MERESPEEKAELLSELRSIEEHLRRALEKAEHLGSFMVVSLIKEALEEVRVALDQMPGTSGSDPA
jgi:hypothetical protein